MNGRKEGARLSWRATHLFWALASFWLGLIAAQASEQPIMTLGRCSLPAQCRWVAAPHLVENRTTRFVTTACGSGFERRQMKNKTQRNAAAALTGELVKQTATALTLSVEDQWNLHEFERLLDRVRDRARGVAERYQNGCYLVGRPGSSKTHTVMETLDAIKAPWACRNSRMSPLGLFAFLEEHPEHTCVLDDIPSLFDQRQALQIIMAAMGGEVGKRRELTYTTKDKYERKSFWFNGGIIAISNLPLRRDPLADAVASRVVLLEHEPSDEMIAAFMRHRAIQGYRDLEPQECLVVVEFVITEARAADYRLDLRHMTKAWEDFRLAKHGKALTPWQELVSSSLKRICTADSVLPVRRADEQARDGEIALEVFRRYPEDKQRRDEQWRAMTGKSVDVLYRHGRQLKGAGLL